MVWTRRHLHVLCTIAPLFATLPGLDAAAQAPAGDRPIQGTLSVGVGINQPRPSTFNTTTIYADPPDTETFTGRYHVARGPVFDVGGGALLRSGLGFGVAHSRASSKGTGEFTIVLDHPSVHPLHPDPPKKTTSRGPRRQRIYTCRTPSH